MNATRFDTLVRALPCRASRRGMFAAMASGFLALMPLTIDPEDAAARKKRNKKRRKKNGGTSPTCTDGKQNGSETDIDCGGSCPRRCAKGQRCLSRNDCAGALCNGAIGASRGTCAECDELFSCGAGDACICQPPALGGPRACVKNSAVSVVPVCILCPDTAICVQRFDGESGFLCREPCPAV